MRWVVALPGRIELKAPREDEARKWGSHLAKAFDLLEQAHRNRFRMPFCETASKSAPSMSSFRCRLLPRRPYHAQLVGFSTRVPGPIDTPNHMRRRSKSGTQGALQD